MNKKTTKSKALESFRQEPTIYLNEKDLPEIKDWEVGNKYELSIKSELVSLSKDNFNGDKKYEARFKITKVSSK